jgi:hypothetical protein
LVRTHIVILLAILLVLVAPRVALAQHGPGPLNQTDYELSVTVVNERTLQGTALIRWTHQSTQPTRELWWHLYLNAFSSRESLFFRTLAAQGHRGHPPGRSGSITVQSIEWLGHSGDLLARSRIEQPTERGDLTQMHTVLPEEIPANQLVELRVRFVSVLPDSFARTGCGGGFCLVGQWFPKLAVLERDGRWEHFALHANSEFYADFGRYSLDLTTPAGLSQWGPGISESLAAEPTYTRRRYTLTRAHDVAFAMSRAPMGERAVSIRAALGAVAVKIVFAPNDVSSADRALVAVSRALGLLESRFGPYPYNSVLIILPPRSAEGTGGMEYPAMITIDSQPGLPSFVREVEYVTIHELAHQWFYGLLASDEHAHPFLDEGFAEFATGLVMDELYDRPAFFRLFRSSVGVDFWTIQGGFSASEPSSGPLSRAADQFDSFSSYANTVYRRTAAALGGIEGAQPLETRTWLTQYSREFAGRHPTPTDLLATLDRSAVSVENKQLLRALITTGGRTDLRVSAMSGSGVTLLREGALAPVVDVQLVDHSLSSRTLRWNTSDSPRVVTGQFRSVSIDPAGTFVLDDNRANNHRSLHAPTLSPMRVRLSSILAMLLRWVGP